MSRSTLWLGSLAILSMSTCSAVAADLTPRVAVSRTAAVVETPIECIRWVRQNQSWYNYCDPVPYFARTTYGDYWWDWRWARR